jgi:hypothetical protein
LQEGSRCRGNRGLHLSPWDLYWPDQSNCGRRESPGKPDKKAT